MAKSDFKTIDEEQKSLNDLYAIQEKQLKAIEKLVKSNTDLKSRLTKASSFDLKSRATKSDIEKEEVKRIRDELKKQGEESNLRTKLLREERVKIESESKMAIANAKKALEEEKIRELKRKNAYKEEKDNISLTKANLQLKYMQEDREKALTEKSKTAYQSNILYRAGSNIREQESSSASSIAVSMLTGGLINPVIAQSLGIDKLLTASVKAPFRMLGNAIENRKEARKFKRDSSAVDEVNDKTKETHGLLRSIVDGISNLGKNKEEPKEEKKEESVFSKMIKAGLGVAAALTVLKFDLQEIAGNGTEKLLKFFGASDNIANVGNEIVTKALPGILIGLPFGAKAALIGGAIAYGYNEINEFIGNLKDDPNGTMNNISDSIKNTGWTENAIKGAIYGFGTASLMGLPWKIRLQAAAIGCLGMTAVKAFLNGEESLTKFISQEDRYKGGMLETTADDGVWMRALKATGRVARSPFDYGYESLTGKYFTNDLNAENDAPASMSLTDMSGRVPLNSGFYSKNGGNIPFNIMNNVEAIRGNVVDPLQKALDEEFGKGKHIVTITSSYRNPAYNNRVGGVSRSKHLTGKAMDLQVSGMSPEEVIMFMQNHGIEFDRAIAESNGNTRWLHTEYDHHRKHLGVVAKMDARTKKYAIIDPGKQQNSILGKSMNNNVNWTSEQLNTPTDMLNNNVNSMGELLVENMNERNNDLYFSNDVGNNLQTQIQPIVINNTNGSYNSNDTIYAVGDVARSIILSVS